MHPTIQARIECMSALRIRASVATATFYGMINKPAPKPSVRYQIVNKGTGAYHVIELATGLVKGFRFSWKAALNLSQLLEARADGAKVNIKSWSLP